MTGNRKSGHAEGWDGSNNFLDQLIGLGFTQRDLNIETDYEVFVGKGGPDSQFFHHYIVLKTKSLPSMSSYPIVFELTISKEDNQRQVKANVRILPSDTEEDYKVTVKTTLRNLAELASKVLLSLGPYHVITASCQTFSDKFLKQLGSSGYMTYVKQAEVGFGGSLLLGGFTLYIYSTIKNWFSSDHRQPVPLTGNRQPVPPSSDRQPITMHSNSDGQPVPSSGNRQPVPSSSDRQPVPSSSDRQPMPSNSDGQPVPSSGNRQPVPSSSDGQPVPSSGNRQPVPSSSDRQPVPSSSDRHPVPSSSNRQPVRSSGHRQPVRLGAYRQPFPPSDNRQPVPLSGYTQLVLSGSEDHSRGGSNELAINPRLANSRQLLPLQRHRYHPYHHRGGWSGNINPVRSIW